MYKLLSNDNKFNIVIEKRTYRSGQCLIQPEKCNFYGKTLASATQRLNDHLIEYKHVFAIEQRNFLTKLTITPKE